MGLTTFPEVMDVLARITERVETPVIVDADTGFGNALNVQRTVRGFERAGAAMIQLEDQSFPKRCGHLDGKQVIAPREMCGKLRAAVDARLPRLDLPELILEVHARTGFADRFTHASEGRARIADVATSVCAVLVAEATNTGFEPLVRLDGVQALVL